MKRGKKAGRGRRGGLDDSFGGDGGLAFDKRNRAGRDRGGYHGSRGGGTDSRDCWRGSWRDVGRGNQQGWQGQKRSGGFSGFSTGSFGVMGDVDIINCSSNSPENVIAEIPIANMEDFSCGAVCEKVEKIGCNITHEGELPEFNKHEEIAFTSNPLQDKGASYEVFESSKHVEHHQSRTINVHKETVIRLRKNIEVNSSESAVCPREGSPIQAVVYPSEPDLEPALKHKNDAVPANINGLDDFIRHSTHPKRRVRSLSQTLMNGFGGGSLKEERRSSTKYYSIRATEEECRQFVGDEEGQIRSIHNDGNFNNHRLSKLSIHTNNDEFFYVGGHPPSDGRTSLRSRGTISRQSILRSSDFLPSTCDDELPEEAFEAALSSQSEEYRRMPDVPTILVNGKRLSGSSNVDSHYMTASEQIRSPEVGGEVLEAMISSRSELLSNEDKNTHSEASGTTTFVTPISTYESQEAIKQSLNSNESFCHQKMSDGVGNTYTPYREELQQLPTLQLASSENNFNQDGQLTEMPYERSAEARIPRQFFTTSRQIIDDQSPTVHTCSSEASIDRANSHHPQDMRKSTQNVADKIESPTAQKYSSEISLHAEHNHNPLTASRRSMRLSMANVAEGDEPATAQLNSSEVSLHAGDKHYPLSITRHSVRLSTQNVADDVESATAQVYSSRASLHAAECHHPLSASRQSMRMSTSNVADGVELPTAQVYSSQASLHAAESDHPLTASRQSMRTSTQNVGDDVEPATARMYSSQASLHAADSHPPLTASRQSMRKSTSNVADDVELPTAPVYSSQASLHAADSHPPLTASRQSMQVSTSYVADDVELPTAQVYSSQASLHAADSHPPLTASRQSMQLSTQNVVDDAEPATAQVGSSQESLHATDSHPPLTASRQSMRTSTQNVGDDVEPATARMYSSQASLHAAECHHPLTFSRQSMQISTSNAAGDVEVPTARLYSSQASLHAADSHPPLTASRQSMQLSTQNVVDDAEPATAQMDSSQASLHAAESHHPLTSSRQSMRISTSSVADDVGLPTAQVYSSQASLHAAGCHHPLTSSRQSMEVYNRDDSEMFQSNLGREVIIPVAQSNLGREVIIEGSNTDHPKPCDSCSLQTLPVMCSRSRGSSQSSVHGFETSSGGLWYHFSNPERIQSSSSSNAKAGHTGIGTSTKTRVQVTSQASSNKTSQRSRSSSRTRQNEVHFSSIPQLFSHPDDRFVVDSSGEPFRPTAEHEQTPKVVNVGSRNLVANCESGSSLPDFHKATVAMDSQLLTVPVQSGTESNVESDMDLPSQAPSLKSIDINPPPDVPPALVVTDALTPKRAPIAVEDQDGHNSPAGLNRTIFSRPAFRRRRFKEPELSEIGIQTGETIRLRQGMSFDQGSSAVTESTTKERLAPFGQTAANTSFERFANNSFEKRGHPASAVISAMLQKRQNEAARSSAENTEPSETAPSSGREMSIRGNAELPPQMINLNKERRRSFIDNQHHPYETRTHQEWRSSTRSQWEEGKLDENFNEVRSSGWTDASNQMQTDKKSTQSNGPHQDMDKLQYSRLSDQVFEEREVLVERNDYCDGSRPHINYAVQPMQKANAGGAKLGQLPLIGSPRKYIKNQDPQKVPHRVQDGMLSKSGQSNVISRETVEQLRKSVVAESRLPSTPSRKTGDGESEMPLLIDIKDLSMTDPVPKSSSLNQDVLYSTPKHETRISMKMKSPSSLWSPTFRGWERRNFASERGDNSPYKWQVPQIDTCKEPREPDVRSNENRSSNRGSTVRRHVPRGRIRDLARLFDGMSREAQRESEVLRGKSLPPPKHRTKCFRTHSLPRSQDYPSRGAEHLPRHERSQDYPSRGAEQLPRHERSQDYPSRGAEQLPRHEPPRDYALNKDPIPGDVLVPYPPTLGDNTESHTSTANQPNFSSTQRNSCSEPLGAAEAQRVGMEWTKPQRNDNEVSGDRDDATSTDSRVDLRRTSTPLGCHLAGDLANAFGRIPPIHYPENPAAYNAKRLESSPAGNLDSVTLPATSELCDKRCAESATHREPSEHHYAEPGVMRAPPPPQRLSVIHPNYGQHGYYEQPRRGQSDQQPYRMSVQVTSRAEPIYAKVHRVSANKIHPPVSYQGLCRPESVSTVASERPPESTETDKMNGEIDRMFEFVEDHDGLSTLGRETESENMSNVVKHGEYGIVRGDVVGQTPDFPTVHPHPLTPRGGPTSTKPSRPDQPLKYSISGYRDMQRAQRIGQISSDAPPRFSPLTAPTPGIGVSTYKSREGTVGEKVSTISRYSRPNTQPSALATSTPVNSPAGTGFSQGPPEVPNLDDSFVSTITTASHLHDAHEEYKRQIAKLNHQIRVQEEQIEMTLKVLALARKKQKSMQELSAQRTLLLARERLELLRCEVNRISALAAVRNPPPPVSRDLRGTMTISNITVHLNRSFCQRQYDQDTSYALLILLKCGAEVEATGPISLLAHQPIRIRQLTFAEHVQFSNLPVDFNVVVEVYAMKLPTAKQADQSCATNIANKCRNLLNPALTRPGRAAYRSDPQASEFARCGYIILNRDTVGANKFYLDEAEYPLEGIIEVYARCTTLPPAIEVDNRGFLTMYQTVSGMASWERYWAVLRRGMVYFWRYPDDESLEKRPVAFMDLSKCTNDEVVACNPEQCPRENSFSIDMLVTTTPSMMEKKRVLLSADSNELLHAWLQALNETLSVLRG